MRGLGGGVDDEADVAAVSFEQVEDGGAIASDASADGSPRSIVLETFEGPKSSNGWDQSYWSGLTFN